MCNGVQSSQVSKSTEGASMPLNAVGEIEYRDAPEPGGIRYQNDPPVCNLCKQEITRENVGWMYLEGRGRTRGKVEFIVSDWEG